MIIGLGGSKGAGKNTAADILVEKYGFSELSFATPLKKLCSVVFDIDYNELVDPQLKESPFIKPLYVDERDIDLLLWTQERYLDPAQAKKLMLEVSKNKALHSPRELLQFVGTDLFRNCDPLYWCKAFMREARDYKNLVVPDVRFPNERSAIKTLHGKMVLIKREDYKQTDSHISENALGTDNEYDCVILNNKDVNALKSALEDYYISIK